MRWTALTPAFALLVTAACGNAAEEGRKAARAEAAIEKQREAAAIKPVDKIKAPVPQGTRVPCEQLIAPDEYTTALGETEPLTVRDSTGTMIDSTASCTLIRGGARPDAKAQEKIIKKQGRLGTIPGDPLCIVTLYCWVVEDAEKFKERCRTSPDKPGTRVGDDGATGGWACKETLPQGEFDVDSYRFLDEDSKCLIQVGGGASVTDNDLIATCARTARATINGDHIKPGAPARYSTTPPAGDDTAATP
ncbi:MAG TPA: hypothetical protein VM734_14965 [Kofleriaceae bacterium]|jgi:hypothetical protein|nr:hypothetical protein [Kofleriaceae bacterium]